MLKTPIARAVTLATLGATLAIPSLAQAALVEDSKASLELRNFYMNRDFGHTTAAQQSKAEEWAQGFLLRFESGFTEGTVGVGVDALGLAGVKLYSSDETGGTGLMPSAFNNEAPGEFSSLGATFKAKVSESVLKVGTLQLKNMAVASSDSRLLPQTFQGGQLISKEIAGLTLDVGYLNRVSNRDSTNNEQLGFTNRGATLNQADPDSFVFAGGTYAATKNLTAGYYYSNLEDIYKQHSTNVIYVHPLSESQSLKTDVRYARSTDDGRSNVDNNAFGAMVTYSVSGHGFGLGYQKMSGDTGFAYLGGAADPYLVNYVMYGDFAKADEKSWQVRYDYNFAAIGIPGLSLMTRYVTGDGFTQTGTTAEGKEWERDTDIAYVFQNGALKGLGLKWRNGTIRSNGTGADVDENRLIVSYTLPLM